MVIADRICVMNQGRPEQIGSPDDIYERPQTRFVAEFIGKTNLLSGTVEEGKMVKLEGGLLLRVGDGASIRNGEKVSVSLRPHNIQLGNEKSELAGLVDRGFNLFTGTVIRQFYFGDAVDYLVNLGINDLVLRVIGPPSQRYDLGQKVVALAHPDHCVVVK
jgi:ABC-type Fe3+/spermidine/putrescine transport system ATPase subunit